MSKKITFISTLILLASNFASLNFATAPPVQAAIQYNDKTYWTFDEMERFAEEVANGSETACDNDEMCKTLYVSEQREQNSPEKYRALEYFKGERLTFTSINPSAETVEFYYRDQDDTMMGMWEGPMTVREMYLAWVENTVPDPRWQAYWEGADPIAPYVADIRNGEMSDGVHKIYSGTTSELGENWLTPYQRITVHTAEGNLKESQNNILHFTILGNNNGNMLGSTDYSSCFSRGDYREGMECRIMYSGTGAPEYFAAYPDDDWSDREETTAAEDEMPVPGENGFWSFTEILEFEKQLRAAAVESCGEGVICEMEYLHEQFLAHTEDYRYSLVEQLKMNNFLVTAFDPVRETVTVYYNDEDYMEWQITGKVHIYLKDLYLAWVEEGYTNPMEDYVAFNDGAMDRIEPSYVADANNGNLREGTHLMFAHTVSDGDPLDSWLVNGGEITISIAGSNLKNNPTNQLYYAAYPNGAPSFVDVIDYSEFSADYKPGMVYRLMYDKTTTYPHWVPQGEAIVEPDSPSVNDELTSDNKSTPEIKSTPSNTVLPADKAFSVATGAEISITGMGVLANTTDNPITNDNSSLEINQQSAPESANNVNNVAVPLAASPEEEHMFPWWIIAFVFSGIVLILWWFIPIRRRKEEEEEE